MENCTLEKLCLKILLHNFLGVYPSDQLPNAPKGKSFSLIINLDTHTEPGSHFVAVFFDKKKIEYFDSYGLPPFVPKIKNFLKSVKKNFCWNNICIQSYTSLHCGLYCLAYLLGKDYNITMKKFVELFNENTLENDEIVNFFIISFLKK